MSHVAKAVFLPPLNKIKQYKSVLDELHGRAWGNPFNLIVFPLTALISACAC